MGRFRKGSLLHFLSESGPSEVGPFSAKKIISKLQGSRPDDLG